MNGETNSEMAPDRVGLWLGAGFSALLLGAGLMLAIGATQMRLWSSTGPGTGFLPLFIGAVLALVSAIYLVQRLLELRAAASDGRASASTGQAASGGDDASAADANIGRAAIIVLTLGLLAWQLEYLGFQISMFAFLLFHLKVLGRQRWDMSLLVAAIGSFGTFALFSGLLRVTLPHSDIPLLAGWGL